jgi:hypothetical protein
MTMAAPALLRRGVLFFSRGCVLPAFRIRSAQDHSRAQAAAEAELKCRRGTANAWPLEIEDDGDQRPPAGATVRAIVVSGAETAAGRQAPPALAKRIEGKAYDDVGACTRGCVAIIPARTAGTDELQADVGAERHVQPSAGVNGLRIRPEIVDTRLGTRRRPSDLPLRTCRCRRRECNQSENERANASVPHARARACHTATA